MVIERLKSLNRKQNQKIDLLLKFADHFFLDMNSCFINDFYIAH